MSEKRIAKVYKYDPNLKIDKFNIDQITPSNIVNHFLVMTQHDITYSVMMRLFGNFNDKTDYNPYDMFDVPKGKFTFLSEPDSSGKRKELSNTSQFTTTLGIWIFNIFLIKGFDYSAVLGGYINENINGDKIEDINQKLIYALAEDRISIESYKRFQDYTQWLMPFETILLPNHTDGVLSSPKLIDKKKAELFKQYGKELDAGNVAVMEKVEKELVAYAKEILKDDPGMDPYLAGAGASIPNNFKNLYILKGSIRDPDPNAKQEFNFLRSNLINGVSSDEYALFANSLAAGPYARSKKTETGGYWEKLITAATQTIVLDEPGTDCGSKQYITEELNSKNIADFMYNWIVKPNGDLEELTSKNMDKYLGKKVNMRFVAYCKSKHKICSKCAGNMFYRRSESRNVGVSCNITANALKLLNMKSFHDGTIKTSEIDPMKAFNIKQ